MADTTAAGQSGIASKTREILHLMRPATIMGVETERVLEAARSMTGEPRHAAMGFIAVVMFAQAVIIVGGITGGAAIWLGRKDGQIDTLTKQVEENQGEIAKLRAQVNANAVVNQGIKAGVQYNARILQNLERALRLPTLDYDGQR